MTFHSEKYGEIIKDYRIVATKKGDSQDFIFDELNGIKMEMSFLNGTFYGMYEVMESSFISTMRFIGDKLFIELISSSRKNKMTTQTKAEEGEEPIIAESFKPLLHQSVLLTRKN